MVVNVPSESSLLEEFVFSLKAESYKERILNPREEVRKAKKEEEFQRFLGPAWKGKGAALGGVSYIGYYRFMFYLDLYFLL